MCKSINVGLLSTTLTVLHLSYAGKSNSVINFEALKAMEFNPDQSKPPLNVTEVDAIRKDVLDKINYYRNHHGLNDVLVDTEIQEFAQTWANETLKKNFLSIQFNPDNKLYGETVAFFTGLRHAGEVAVDLWYYSLRYYKGTDTIPLDMRNVIHLLSKKTSHIGVGVAGYQNGRINIIVDYYPPGYDASNWMANFPVVKQDDIYMANAKWKEIEKQMNPPKQKLIKHVASEFPNGLLPGWQSTMNLSRGI